MAEHSPELEEVLETLKKCAAALRDAGIPYMLGGGVAAWARGGPESVHDVDLMIRPADAEKALDVLERAGLKPERPPEGWLLKAWDGDVLVDLIFQPRGMEIDEGSLDRAELMNVKSQEMPVMALEDVISTKLLALSERWLDYDQLLHIARACREQIDWEEIRARTEESPFARAFMVIVDGLGISDAGEQPSSPSRTRGPTTAR
jgi:hypothetical protein